MAAQSYHTTKMRGELKVAPYYFTPSEKPISPNTGYREHRVALRKLISELPQYTIFTAVLLEFHHRRYHPIEILFIFLKT